MPRKELGELTSAFNSIVGESTDDAVISFLEDLSDSFQPSRENELIAENEELRRKYKERFESVNVPPAPTPSSPPEDTATTRNLNIRCSDLIDL